MFTLQASENPNFFVHVRPDGSVCVDVMTQDQANADPNCQFNWEGATPFALKTADGRFVAFGGPPDDGVFGVLQHAGIYAYSADSWDTRFDITEFDSSDSWQELTFTFNSTNLAYPVEPGQLYLRKLSDGDDDTVFYASRVPS